MPQADASPSTSRRAVLSQLAVLPLVGSFGTLMPDAQAFGGADATLLARITQAIETHRVMNDRAHEFTDDECLALSDAFDDQLEALADMQAVTPEGLSAKARLIRLYLPPYFRAFEVDQRSPEIRLLSSFIEDATLFAQRNAA
ncbi:hypothetical protein ACFFGF_09835 [Asaia lannensis]|uniref:Uncharacterized protein n=1 Tax=Asaia lannensis NBRC 102526 TaxID=1307926 RepID=A0ABT1CJH9_9PROT|nr:hypothetical protein [Asaia lannensis]MCO6161017.1 hypothetical protein [Asaia lannensis NBRC 102526]